MGNGSFRREGVKIVRRDIQDLIKLALCFRKTTTMDLGKRMLGKEARITRIEPLGFVEEELALIPLSSPASDISKQLRNMAAIRQELSRLLNVTRRRVVIL